MTHILYTSDSFFLLSSFHFETFNQSIFDSFIKKKNKIQKKKRNTAQKFSGDLTAGWTATRQMSNLSNLKLWIVVIFFSGLLFGFSADFQRNYQDIHYTAHNVSFYYSYSAHAVFFFSFPESDCQLLTKLPKVKCFRNNKREGMEAVAFEKFH